MGSGEARFCFPFPFDPAASMELRAMVRSDGSNSVLFTQKQFDGALPGLLLGDSTDFANAHQAAAPFHNGDDSGLGGTVNRVDLTIAEP